MLEPSSRPCTPVMPTAARRLMNFDFVLGSRGARMARIAAEAERPVATPNEARQLLHLGYG